MPVRFSPTDGAGVLSLKIAPEPNVTISSFIRGPTGPAGPAGPVDTLFATRVAAAAATISSSLTWVRTQGYTTVGDGGEGLYKKQVSNPGLGGFQSADGGWWALQPSLEGMVSAKQFGAKGDGVVDDYQPLQDAIDFAITNFYHLFIPTGIFCISNTLVVGANSGMGINFYYGQRIFGAGIRSASKDFAMTNFHYGGTIITATWTGNKSAMMQINYTADSRFFRLEHLGLELNNYASNSATYGILFNDTVFSNARLDSVIVAAGGAATIAFAAIRSVGANGEFIDFHKCYAYYCDGFFKCTSGQSFIHAFYHCGAVMNSGSIWFDLEDTNGGLGLYITDFSGTAQQTNGISNSTFLKDNLNTSSISVKGGRLELISQVYYCSGGSPVASGIVSIENMEFVIDFDPTNVHLSVLTSFSNPQSAFYNFVRANSISINNCNFEAQFSQGTNQFPIFFGLYGNLKFDNCKFLGFQQPPAIMTYSGAVFQSCRFVDCQTDVGNSDGGSRLSSFDLNFEQDTTSAGVRRIFDDSAWIQSGRPQNFLVKPQVAIADGAAVTPDAPWVISSGTIGANGPQSSSSTPSDNSPIAKTIDLAGNQSIYQDITAVDLSLTTYSKGFSGINVFHLTYMLLVDFIGVGAGKIQILDSVNGAEYGRFEWTAGGQLRFQRNLITVQARVQQRTVPAYPRLKISSTDGTGVTLQIAAQGFFAEPNASFMPGNPYGTTHYTADFGGIVESLGVYHRLALPYKSDVFGSTPTVNALPDLVSDIYLSSTTGLLNIYRDGNWEQPPPQVRVAAIPTTGQWPQGSLAWLKGMATGASPGWGQVTAGDRRTNLQWNASTLYIGGQVIYNGTNVYIMIKASGTSAAATGPTTTGAGIVDNTCTWDFVGTLAPTACTSAWTINTPYVAGDIVTNDTVPVKVYKCTTTGTSAGATGPTGGTAGGTGAYNIVDNTAQWKFIGVLAVFKAMANLA